MTDAAHPLRIPSHDQRAREIPISLIRGGFLYRVQEKARLIGPRTWGLRRRLPLALAIAWLPLPILAATHGGVDDLRALLIDYRVYARVLIAIPLLLVAQLTMEIRFREMAQQFLDANIIRIADLSRFRQIMQRTRRLRDAKLPEFIIIVAVYAAGGLSAGIGQPQVSGMGSRRGFRLHDARRVLLDACHPGVVPHAALDRGVEVVDLGGRPSTDLPNASSAGRHQW